MGAEGPWDSRALAEVDEREARGPAGAQGHTGGLVGHNLKHMFAADPHCATCPSARNHNERPFRGVGGGGGGSSGARRDQMSAG